MGDKITIQTEIYEFFDNRVGDEREKVIKDAAKKFKKTQKVIGVYYCKWRKEYLVSSSRFTEEEICKKIKGEYSEYMISKNKVIAGELEFKSIESIEKYEAKEIREFKNRMEEVKAAYRYATEVILDV